MNEVENFIEALYQEALTIQNLSNLAISTAVKDNIRIIVENAENKKGVLAVTVTSLIYKCLHSNQDIRCHQTSIPNGYSGRTFDTNYITPFLRAKSFPNMAESGWLTRSLEHKVPYTLDYSGAIQPTSLKNAFLQLLNEVETQELNIHDAVVFLFHELISQRDAKRIELAKPKNLSIDTIMKVLKMHFTYAYSSRGGSRLPVLAFYAIYQSLVRELKRYDNKRLLPLENHTSADAQSGRLGDIEVVDEQGNSFEVVEVKHEIPISINVVERAKEKILPSTVTRYYILSTAEIKNSDKDAINGIIHQVKNSHGCQIVVNGIIPSLKYYLRLLENPTSFLANYVELLNVDEALKFEHKVAWNNIIANL